MGGHSRSGNWNAYGAHAAHACLRPLSTCAMIRRLGAPYPLHAEDEARLINSGEEKGVPSREALHALSSHIASQLKTLVSLTLHFCGDVLKNEENSSEILLDELQGKIHPCLVSLDEEMTTYESSLRRGIDRANVKDDRVDWLLRFNAYQGEMRAMLRQVSNEIYDDLDNVLCLRTRGCTGLNPHETSLDGLRRIEQRMCRMLAVLASDQ